MRALGRASLTCVVAFAAAGAEAGAAAAAPWTAGAPPALTGVNATLSFGYPALAMSATGDVALASTGPDGVHVAVRPAGGTFSPLQVLGGSGASQPAIAINAAGVVAVAWNAANAVHVALRPPG